MLVLNNLAPGDYRVYLENTNLTEDWVSGWIDGTGSFEESVPVRISEAETVTEATARLTEGAQISGRVNSPQEAYTVYTFYLLDAETGQPAYVISCLSCFDAEESSYQLRSLAPGTYKLGAVPYLGLQPGTEPPPETCWYPGTFDADAAETITLAGTELVEGVEWVYPATP